MWALLQCLDTLVHVRVPIARYPLNRYWLELQEANFQSGRISAFLEFVERVHHPEFMGISLGAPKAIIKKYGFIWMVEQVLVSNQIELVLSLFWQDLTPGAPSRYEEIILLTFISLTREIIDRVDQAVPPVPAAAPISGPPPGGTASVSQPLSGPPPVTIAGQAAARSNPAGQQKSHSAAFASMSRTARVGREEQTRRLVDWPSPQDFHEAVQNPSYCFADKFLRNGMPETDAMGMPRVSSGAFASVYRIRCIDRDRAVRCFLQPIKDQQYRYAIMGTSLSPQRLPWIVDFDYFAQGIRVAGQWYPILTMDWVEGTPLNVYVAELCETGNAEELEKLQERFQEMIAGLSQVHVAHGDLQHGNILVRNGRLVLVDYDGMFVPGLKEQSSNEIGHANYQHPERSEHHFNETLDHFSSWVIDTALLCLKEDPSLIRFCYDGESMIFHRQDFIQPERSAVLAHLAGHDSSLIRSRASSFKELLHLQFEEIPPLEPCDGLPDSLNSGSETAESKAEVRHKSPGLPDWLDDIE